MGFNGVCVCFFFFNFSKLSKHLRPLTPSLMKFHLFKMIERNSKAAVLSCLNGGTQFWFQYNFFGHYRNCPDWLQGLSSELRISSVRLHHSRGWIIGLKPECKWERETSNLGAFACKVNICITRRWQHVLWSADYHRDEHLQRQHFHLREAERRVIGYELQYWLSLRACSARQQEYGTLRPPLSIMKWRGKKGTILLLEWRQPLFDRAHYPLWRCSEKERRQRSGAGDGISAERLETGDVIGFFGHPFLNYSFRAAISPHPGYKTPSIWHLWQRALFCISTGRNQWWAGPSEMCWLLAFWNR